MKKIYCLADAHLGEYENSFEEFFSAIANISFFEVSHFIILGDLFKYFIGMNKWISEEQFKILEKIFEIKNNGVETIFIEGNRDFFLEKKILGKYFDFINNEYTITHKGKKILFLHGDKVNKKDIKYLIWNKFSKSIFLYLLTKTFPKNFLLPFYNLVEKSLKNINFKYREKIPLNEITFFVNSLNENYDLIILGHFHKDYETIIGNKKVILLPAFKDNKKIWSLEYEN